MSKAGFSGARASTAVFNWGTLSIASFMFGRLGICGIGSFSAAAPNLALLVANIFGRLLLGDHAGAAEAEMIDGRLVTLSDTIVTAGLP